MKIITAETKVVYTVEYTFEDYKAARETYLKDPALKQRYPRAFCEFCRDPEDETGELAFVSLSVITSRRSAPNDTFSAMARIWGYDGWQNCGFYDEKNGRRQMTVYHRTEAQEQTSAVEQLHKRYGWPLKIHARGCDAYLVGAQPLNEGDPEPIYRFPGGDSLVDKAELRAAGRGEE